jgi:hypothetical protein
MLFVFICDQLLHRLRVPLREMNEHQFTSSMHKGPCSSHINLMCQTTALKNGAYHYDAHFWLGKNTSQVLFICLYFLDIWILLMISLILYNDCNIFEIGYIFVYLMNLKLFYPPTCLWIPV